MSDTKVEILENNKVKITFSISAEKFEEGLNYSYNQNKSKVTIPGFRKGKVPRKMIEAQYGKEFLYDDAINFVLPEAYEKAILDNNLDVVSRPNIDIENVNESGATIIAEVFVKPAVLIEDYVGVEISKIEKEVTDEELQAEINKELENNSRVITISDRPVKDGDIVAIDFEGFVDGVPFEGGKGENVDLNIGSHSFIDTFEEQLIGKNIGDDVEVNVTFPEEYHAENLKGAKALFKVKINSIKKKDLPEVNDDFAAEVSEFDTLEEYKNNLKEKLAEGKLQKAEREKENKVLEVLINKAKIDVPQPMIENRIDQMVQDFASQMEKQGLKLDDYLNYMGQDMKSLRDAYKNDADMQVRGRLILEEIGNKENFVVTDEDFDAEISRIADAYKMEKEKLTSVLRDEDKEGIEKDLKTQKALKLILDSAVEV